MEPLSRAVVAAAAANANVDTGTVIPMNRSPNGNNNESIHNKSQPSSKARNTATTLQETLVDLGSWWCHRILSPSSTTTTLSSSNSENNNSYIIEMCASARQLKEVERLIQILDPVSANSPIVGRLRCLVIWKEFIQQILILDEDGNLIGDGSHDIDENQSSSCNRYINNIGRRNFTTLLRQLKAAHDTFSPNTATTAKTTTAEPSNYDDVITLVDVHGKLSCLYRAFAPESIWEMSHQELCSILDDCSDDFSSIFAASLRNNSNCNNNDGNQTNDEDDGDADAVVVVPRVLAKIVDTNHPNLTPQLIQQRIRDVLLGCPPDDRTTAMTSSRSNNDEGDDQSFSCARLKTNLQKLLLYWCELGVEGNNLPELVRLGYKEIGIDHATMVAREKNPGAAAGFADVGITDRVDNSTVMVKAMGASLATSNDDDSNNNGRDNSKNNINGDHSQTVQKRNITRKRKRHQRTSNAVNDDDDDDDANNGEKALDMRRQEQDLTVEWPNGDTSSTSSSDRSHRGEPSSIEMKLRPKLSAEMSDESEWEKEQQTAWDFQTQIKPRRRRQGSAPASSKAVPKLRLSATSGIKISSTASTLSSGNRDSFMSPAVVAMTPRPSTTTRRYRSGPLPVNRGDFMTQPEESTFHGDHSSGNSGMRSHVRKRRRIRWEYDEDRALQEGIDVLGFGNWAAIKADYASRLRRRTNADIKDRARNLQKQGVVLRQPRHYIVQV